MYDCAPKVESQTGIDISGCPAYEGVTRDIYASNPCIKIVFANKCEYDDFTNKMKPFGKLTLKSKTSWYPYRPDYRDDVKSWACLDKDVKNEHTIYIPSYKRPKV